MKHFQLIAPDMPVQPVMQELEACADLWNSCPMRKTYPDTPHVEMDDIWVRYNDYDKLQGDRLNFNKEHIPVWYPVWKRVPSLRNIIFPLMVLVDGEMIGGIFITKIPPGAKIHPHKDNSWHVQQYEKFYVSLQSAEGATFGCKVGEEVEVLTPKTGECWLFDNRKEHWVDNDSPIERITLIVSIRTDKFGWF